MHSNIWTSPVPSISGIRNYVLFLDQFNHFIWVYPLRKKSDVLSKFIHFASYIKTQFNCQIKSLQCDNGREFKNANFQKYFDQNAWFIVSHALTLFNKMVGLSV